MKKVKMFGFLTERQAQRKVQKEQGRSMVEMLGVLAIIGVLSIGAIAGYTMAMNRYRANEIIDLGAKLSVAAQTSASTANNQLAWNDAMRSVSNEFGLDFLEAGYYNRNYSVHISGPFESTYDVTIDGSVAVYVSSNQEQLRNAIDSVTGIRHAGHGGPRFIEGRK